MATLRELAAYRRLGSFVPTSAQGSFIHLSTGERVLDLYGGHCVNTLGAGDAGLGAAIDAAWKTCSFQTNLLDLDARAKFLEAYQALLPEGAWDVFFTNSGAEANENALKAALLATGRERVVAFEGAFHGRTAAAAAVTDKAASFPCTPFPVTRIPWGDLDAAEAAIGEDVACVILEPIQSMAGVREPAPQWLESLREWTSTAGAVLVFDEVQTANGRLGVPFAAQHYGVTPDVITTAKGAGGGLPIGVTLIAEAVAERIPPGHFGSTFGGGPLVLAAATEVARRIGEPSFCERVLAAGEALRAAAAAGPVVAVRGVGLLLGLELEPGLTAGAMRDHLLGAGILTGTCDDPSVLRLSPALTLTPAEAGALGEALAGFEVNA